MTHPQPLTRLQLFSLDPIWIHVACSLLVSVNLVCLRRWRPKQVAGGNGRMNQRYFLKPRACPHVLGNGAPVTSEKSFVRDMLANMWRHVRLMHQHKCKSVGAWLHDCALRNERPLYRPEQRNKKTLFFHNLQVIVSFLSDPTFPTAALFSHVGINQCSNGALSVAIHLWSTCANQWRSKSDSTDH